MKSRQRDPQKAVSQQNNAKIEFSDPRLKQIIINKFVGGAYFDKNIRL